MSMLRSRACQIHLSFHPNTSKVENTALSLLLLSQLVRTGTIHRQSLVLTLFNNFTPHFITWYKYPTLHLFTLNKCKSSKINKTVPSGKFRKYLVTRTHSHTPCSKGKT